jgi:hypothetical protein
MNQKQDSETLPGYPENVSDHRGQVSFNLRTEPTSPKNLPHFVRIGNGGVHTR